MSLQVGSIIEGVVKGITNFGAFIELEEGKTGLVHISEVANTFVKDVKDFLKENEKVKVKVISIGLETFNIVGFYLEHPHNKTKQLKNDNIYSFKFVIIRHLHSFPELHA